MEKQKTEKLTREKHLDHMVKVVPFIFFCYGLQCFAIAKMGNTNFTGTTLMFLGVALAALATMFALYDLKHEVQLHQGHLTISFLGYKKEILYKDIIDMHVDESDKSFCKLKIITSKSKHTFYFIDNGTEAKQWIVHHRQLEDVAEDFSRAA